VALQARWSELNFVGFRCKKCGEFSVDPAGAIHLSQLPPWKREQLSRVIAAIWNNGKGVAPRLDQDGVARVAAAGFASTTEEPFGKPLDEGVATLTAFFFAQRQARS
jgi:hypothetical protein